MTHNVILNTIGEAFAPEAKKILAGLGATEYVTVTQEELKEAVGPCSILIVQLGLTIDKAVMEKAPHLNIITTATTGLDHIDVTEAANRGIAVLSLKGETEFLRSVTSTAELALGLMIALVRKIAPASAAVLGGEWKTVEWKGTQLHDKTLGVVGVGRLGTMMANYGKALGMTVIGHDAKDISSICGQKDLPTLLAESDVVSLHLPLEPETERMLDAKAFQRMKPGAVLINTARGKIVDEAALLQSLEKGHLAGYAADVLDGETAFGHDCSAHPLVAYARSHDNVLITPHIGGTTRESRAATDIFIAEKLARHLRGESRSR